MKEKKDLGMAFWAVVSVSAIALGVGVAFVAGFFLGHFTGHTHTTTVTSASTLEPGTGGEETAAGEENEGETANVSIEAAPAFSAEELEKPTSEWITNGGSLTNDRFSPLSEISTENVKELKGDWMTKIGQNATAAKFSAEGTALYYKGTIYISDGADDVFAINAGSGEIVWEYKPNLPPDPLGNVICCGWDNRGVAIGDGNVYVAQLNGDIVALDQTTGKVKWTKPVVPATQGYSITSAPLYYDGKVYVGGSGAEYGVRGRLTAFDAETGKLDWRFYTVPAPNETGGNTWPKGTDAYKHGGASIWNTPTVDPKLNMLYFSTGNASPDWSGKERKGDNLFTSSIVALDATTGKYKWHYQQVHHDLWDFDSPSPTVLVDGEMEGKMQEAVAQPSKTGWLYILDRKTGKPIFPIPEKPVAQDPSENTAPTQPTPTLPPFAPQYPTKEGLKVSEEAAATQKPAPKAVAKPIFYPMSHNPKIVTVTAPDAVGGDNWQPSSFDPEKDMYFVCSQAGTTGVVIEKHPPVYKAGETFTGSLPFFASTGFNAPGQLTAYDLSTGKIAWQDKFPESCYSGAVTTAGGLVFVGQNNGEFQAFNSENGELLWHFQTGAGANTTATVFEDEGEEKVAIYAGGNSLAATPHGENFWVFSLKGTMEELKGTEAEAEGTEHKGETEKGKEGEAEPEAGGEEAPAGGAGGNATAGASVFEENCSTCHGATGHGGNGGPDLRTMPLAKTEAGAIKQVTNGGAGMPAFKGSLSSEEIENVAAYVVEKIVGK
jgi:alcohol dehydrogenase (cytochrome c)